MSATTPLLLALMLATSSLPALANPTLSTGDTLPALSLTDQHDKPMAAPQPLQRIIFAADNTAASLVTAQLDSKPADWLNQTHSVYLADIHKMPGLITRMFALPQLREKPYAVILGREEADLAMFPRQKGCVTLLPVSDNRLGTVRFACTEEELKAALN